MKRYPFIEVMAVRGRKIAMGLAILVLIVGAMFAGLERNVSVLGWTLVAGGICYLGVRLLAELIEVIADTLLPR